MEGGLNFSRWVGGWMYISVYVYVRTYVCMYVCMYVRGLGYRIRFRKRQSLYEPLGRIHTVTF